MSGQKPSPPSSFPQPYIPVQTSSRPPPPSQVHSSRQALPPPSRSTHPTPTVGYASLIPPEPAPPPSGYVPGYQQFSRYAPTSSSNPPPPMTQLMHIPAPNIAPSMPYDMSPYPPSRSETSGGSQSSSQSRSYPNVDYSSAFNNTRVLDARPADRPRRPFILDSGASNHISPEKSDFLFIRPITPQPIQGFNGSSTDATGIGDIDLCIAPGRYLRLKDVLYVPSCNTRLISVSALTRDGYHFVTFEREGCWVVDMNNKVIARGSLSGSNRLYNLNYDSRDAGKVQERLDRGASSSGARGQERERWRR